MSRDYSAQGEDKQQFKGIRNARTWPMRVVVDHSLHFDVSGVKDVIVRTLLKSMRFKNPAFAKKKLGNGEPSHIPEFIYLGKQRGYTVTTPRGGADWMRKAFGNVELRFKWDNRRLLLQEVPYEFGTKLRVYQQEAVDWFVENQQGFITFPCGGGKTVTGVATIAVTRQPALVVVHTRELVDQWDEEIKKGIGLRPTILCQKKRLTDAPVTVATVQTLRALSEDDFRAVDGRTGFAILDEAHHVPAATFLQVIGKLRAHYRLGLTATPYREDSLTQVMNLVFSKRRYQIDRPKLVREGYSLQPTIRVIQTGARPVGSEYHELVSYLVRDLARNQRIVDIVKRDASDGHTFLVLSGRVEHCKTLADMIRSEGVEAVAVYGALAKAKRAHAFDRFRDGELKVICATTLADEGLDVPRLSRILLATSNRARARTTQRIGRVVRTFGEKSDPIVYDLVDDHWTMQSQFEARLEVYAKEAGGKANVQDEEGTPWEI